MKTCIIKYSRFDKLFNKKTRRYTTVPYKGLKSMIHCESATLLLDVFTFNVDRYCSTDMYRCKTKITHNSLYIYSTHNIYPQYIRTDNVL